MDNSVFISMMEHLRHIGFYHKSGEASLAYNIIRKTVKSDDGKIYAGIVPYIACMLCRINGMIDFSTGYNRNYDKDYYMNNGTFEERMLTRHSEFLEPNILLPPAVYFRSPRGGAMFSAIWQPPNPVLSVKFFPREGANYEVGIDVQPPDMLGWAINKQRQQRLNG